jgi:site-specific DNA-methyltransferase (adenine-specific)
MYIYLMIKKQHIIHRTQKPVKLLEWLIKTYSNEEDLVMDFCMGSGTAGVACKNTNRKFIGVELDKEIYDLAEKRIKDC